MASRKKPPIEAEVPSYLGADARRTTVCLVCGNPLVGATWGDSSSGAEKPDYVPLCATHYKVLGPLLVRASVVMTKAKQAAFDELAKRIAELERLTGWRSRLFDIHARNKLTASMHARSAALAHPDGSAERNAGLAAVDDAGADEADRKQRDIEDVMTFFDQPLPFFALMVWRASEAPDEVRRYVVAQYPKIDFAHDLDFVALVPPGRRDDPWLKNNAIDKKPWLDYPLPNEWTIICGVERKGPWWTSAADEADEVDNGDYDDGEP